MLTVLTAFCISEVEISEVEMLREEMEEGERVEGDGGEQLAMKGVSSVVCPLHRLV